MRRAVLHISPTLLTLSVARAGLVTSFAERSLEAESSGVTIEPGRPIAVGDALRSAAPMLAEAVRQTEAEGLPTTIVLHGLAADGACVVQSFPRKLGSAAARSGASLALDAVCKFDRSGAPSAAFVVANDSARAHAIGLAVDDPIVQAAHDLAESCGLKPAGVLPSEAVTAAGAIAAALASAERRDADPSPTAYFWLDASTACLCVTADHRLLLTRTVSIGLDAIVESLSKPVRAEGQPIACVRFDRASARRLLTAAGIPLPDAPIDGHPGLTGASLLPLMQPVLQRLAVEIKQSVRFGISEEQRRGLTLRVIGPAGDIPRISEILAALSGLARSSPESTPTYEAQPPTIPAALEAVALRPNAFRRAREVLAVRGLAVASSALAIAWVAFSAWSDRADAHALQADLIVRQTAADQARRQLARAQEAQAFRSVADAFEARVSAALADAASWPAMLAWLAQNTGDRIRLVSIQCESQTPTESSIRLQGIAQASDRDTVQADVAALLARLRNWPPAARVHLRSAEQHEDGRNHRGLFEITIDLVDLPERSSTTADAIATAPTNTAEVRP